MQQNKFLPTKKLSFFLRKPLKTVNSSTTLTALQHRSVCCNSNSKQSVAMSFRDTKLSRTFLSMKCSSASSGCNFASYEKLNIYKKSAKYTLFS